MTSYSFSSQHTILHDCQFLLGTGGGVTGEDGGTVCGRSFLGASQTPSEPETLWLQQIESPCPDSWSLVGSRLLPASTQYTGTHTCPRGFYLQVSSHLLLSAWGFCQEAVQSQSSLPIHLYKQKPRFPESAAIFPAAPCVGLNCVPEWPCSPT